MKEIKDILTILRQHNVGIKLQNDEIKLINLPHHFPVGVIENIRKRKTEIVSYIANKDKKKNKTIPRISEQAHYELSGSQKRLWILSQLEGGSAAYNMPFTFMLDGELKINAFEKAIYTLIERHESLRTVFVEIDGEPRQKVLTISELPKVFNIISLQRDKNNTEHINSLLKELVQETFDLNNGPLIKLTLRSEEHTSELQSRP